MIDNGHVLFYLYGLNEIIDLTVKNTIGVNHALCEKHHGKLVFTSSFGLETPIREATQKRDQFNFLVGETF